MVDGLPLLHCLRTDLPILETCHSERSEVTEPQATGLKSMRLPILLAPLDPLIYDRRLTSALWNFDYTWEAYVPPAKRKRGYYALPVLAGIELVGHVDPKADREKNRLRLMSRRVRRGHKTTGALASLASFLGLK